MKNLSFSAAALFAFFLFSSSGLQAQLQRPVIVPDADFNNPRYNQELMRQRMTAEEVMCLQNTTQVLQQSFSAHCKARRIPTNTLEGELLRALTELNTDVTHLANDIHGRCGKTGRVELSHVYRTFHLAEYSSRDAQIVAAQAGYVRSLTPYFQDIDSHLEQLGRLGFRNPRLRRVELDSPYTVGRSSVPERQLSLPPVPRAVPATPTQPRPHDHGKDKKDNDIDLGDVLKNLFRQQFR